MEVTGFTATCTGWVASVCGNNLSVHRLRCGMAPSFAVALPPAMALPSAVSCMINDRKRDNALTTGNGNALAACRGRHTWRRTPDRCQRPPPLPHLPAQPLTNPAGSSMGRNGCPRCRLFCVTLAAPAVKRRCNMPLLRQRIPGHLTCSKPCAKRTKHLRKRQREAR